MKVLVIGASLAGLRVAEALRGAGFDGGITLVGAEEHLPYDRPPLSKQILNGEAELDDILLREPGSLDDLHVDLRLACVAERLDVGSQLVQLRDGTSVRGDVVVLATGARARWPSEFPTLGGVLALRTVDDAIELRDRLIAAQSVLVVGAGFIGSEVATAARRHGCSVTVVEAGPHALNRVVGPALASRFERLHEAAGTSLRVGTTVRSLIGRRDVEGAVLSDGDTIACDLVVLGAGAIPNTEWLHGAPLDVRDGVRCDGRGRPLGEPGLYAVGDVACWSSARFADAVRTEHWTAAADQAAVVAADVLGLELPAEPVPYVWSDQFGRRVQIGGRSRPGDEIHVAIESHDQFLALTGRSGRLASVISIDAPRFFARARRLLQNDCSWNEAREHVTVAAAG